MNIGSGRIVPQDLLRIDKSIKDGQFLEMKELKKIILKLEKHYKDMQDIEFTVENNKLWMLQTRSGKRTIKGSSCAI